MTIFVDASAKVAMLLKELDHESLADRLQADRDRIWSPISRWETAVSLSRTRKYAFEHALADVTELAEKLGLRMIAISDEEARLATEAYDRYGKGRHPAGLNMGDCFAYACAKAHGARLLYKGNDFGHTDLAWPNA